MREVINRLLKENPDGVMANFAIKGGAGLLVGAIRACRLPDVASYYLEARCRMQSGPKPGDVAEATVYFHADDLAFLMIPCEPPAIVTPNGDGKLVRGILSGDGN